MISGILFSHSVRFAFLAKSVTLGINTKSLVSILFTFATNLSCTVFLTTLFFTTSLSLLKSAGTGANLSMSNLLNSVFKLAKLVWLRKVLTHFYMRPFFSIQLLKQWLYPFHLTYNLSPFLLSTFSIRNSF